MKKTKLNIKKLSETKEPLNNANEKREACILCGLYENTQHPFMRPFIPKNWTGQALFIKTEGGSFFGSVSRLLKRLSQRTGYTDKAIAVASAIRCSSKNDAAPTMQQIRCCRPFLLQTITKLHPKVVIGFGSTALRALKNSGDSNVTKSRGKKLEVPGI